MSMNYKQILFLILGLDTLILLFQVTELSISYKEVLILEGDISFLQLLVNSSFYLFGRNDFALRLPMILFHIGSAILFYEVSKEYIKREKDRLWLLLVYVLLPGVMSSAIVVNSAGIIIFGLFLFLYLYQKFDERYVYGLLILYAFIEADFSYLFASLVIYSIYTKNRNFFILNIILFIISISLYGLYVKGVPSGHFLDTIGIYATVFSSIVFVYIIYTLSKKYILKELDIIWFISSTVLIYSLIISFRQKIAIEHFAPYLIIALPLAGNFFIRSYRVRLKQFRKNYKNIFIVALSLLFIHSLIIFCNKEFYAFIEKPKKHFAYKMHIAKELAKNLQLQSIKCVTTDKKMSMRLKFYGIESCSENVLSKIAVNKVNAKSVTVSYANRVVYSATVTKLNSK